MAWLISWISAQRYGQNTKFSKNYLWFAGQELPKVAWQNLFISSRYWINNEQISFYSAQDVVEIILMKITLPLLNTFH
jgi:hypothetical protein